MSLKFTALKNVGSNWFGIAVSLIVGVFLSPFILHSLGDDAFGLWILIFSFTGFYGIFDLGIRSSIVKYVAEFEATGDRDRLTRLVNVSFFAYSCIGLILLVAVSIGSVCVDLIFRISPNFQHSARLLFLMVGWAVALGFPLSTFGGVLEGLQRFFFLNLTQSAASLLRALLIVIAIRHGKGLLTISFITVIIPLACYLTYAWHARHLLQLRFGKRFIDRPTFRQISHYSAFSFISIVARQLRFQADAVIIGAMLSTAAITRFSIGSKLIGYSTLVVGGLGAIITPMSSQFDVSADRERLRKLLILGNRACALTAFPIGVLLLVLGKSIIDVWVGPQYESSYIILLILLIPSLLWDIQTSSRQILYGMGLHKALALVNVVEGLVNVVISIMLIRHWGIVGDALGTAIPLTLTCLFFLPSYLCRKLGVSLKDFVCQAYLLPLMLCVPMVAAVLCLQRLFHPRNYLQLASQMAGGCLVYAAGALWLLFTSGLGVEVRSKFRQSVLQAFGR